MLQLERMELEQTSVRQLLGVLRMENTGRSDIGQLQVRSCGSVTVEKRATLPFRHQVLLPTDTDLGRTCY